MNAKRLLKAILCICLVLSMLAAVAAPAIGAGHDCTGELCCVCLCLQTIQSVKSLVLSLFILLAAWAVLCCLCRCLFAALPLCSAQTPTRLKVKLLN